MTNPNNIISIDASKIMDLNNFERIGNVGQGTSSEAVQYKEKRTGQMYCVKIYRQSFIRGNPNSNNIFLKEVSLLSRIDYPAVLSLYGFNMLSQNVQGPYIITKYYPKNLRYIITTDGISLSKKYLIMLGITEGMKYLHSINITHRDLKPENIFLDEDDHPVIGDLGFSKFGSQNMSTDVGTFQYMAPEVSDGRYSNKVDVFSFSIIFYEVLTQSNAYNNINTCSCDFFSRVRQGFRPDDTILTSDFIRNFLIRCWSPDPAERPTFQEIVEMMKRDDFKQAMQADAREVSSYLSTLDNQKDPALIKQKADEGNVYKCIEYADILRTGEIVPIDEDGALHYYRIAAESNDTYAMQQCGRLLIKKNHKDEAAAYLRRAIEIGDSDSLQLFIDEKLDEMNRDEVANLFRICADNGNPDAMYHYAVMLYYGLGVVQDKLSAFRYFKNAADNGNIPANGYAGRMLEEGDGTNKDTTRANYYYRVGIDKRDSGSMLFHSISVLNGDYSEINKSEIVESFKKSADLGSQAAMLFYAIILLSGYFDVEINDRLANDYIEQAKTINSKEATSLTFNFAFNIYENKIKHFQKKDADMFFKISLTSYINLLPKDDALNYMLKASKIGCEVAREMYCNLVGLFHSMFYRLEQKRLKYNADVLPHAARVIAIACSSENRQKLIDGLKKKNVNSIEGAINEIKTAFRFVYIVNPSDEALYQGMNDELIRRILNGKMCDSDFLLNSES